MSKNVASLLRLIELYAGATGLPDSTISKRVFGQGHKIKQLQAGGDITTARLEAAMVWFSDNWPLAVAQLRAEENEEALKTRGADG